MFPTGHARRNGCWKTGLALVGLLCMAPCLPNAWAEESTTLDCGVNALFVMLQLEGRPVTIDRLLSALPTRHPNGYSMAELADAARSVGLKLEGISFGPGDPPLTRPAIVFLKEARGGHFAVLRPVGTTGTMVQVIDPPHAPWIADYDRVFKTRAWTGRALLPRPFWTASSALPLGLASAGVIILLFGRRMPRWRMLTRQ